MLRGVGGDSIFVLALNVMLLFCCDIHTNLPQAGFALRSLGLQVTLACYVEQMFMFPSKLDQLKNLEIDENFIISFLNANPDAGEPIVRSQP